MKKSTNLLDSFKYAFSGIRFAIIKNRNMKIHLLAAVLVIILGLYLNINKFEAGIVSIMICLVIITEMINTALEEVVNLVTKDYKLEAKIAKDISAGAVLVVSIASVIVGLMVFLPYFL